MVFCWFLSIRSAESAPSWADHGQCPQHREHLHSHRTIESLLVHKHRLDKSHDTYKDRDKKKIIIWGDNYRTIKDLMQVDWIFSKNYKYMLSFALSSYFCFADMIPVKVNGVCFNIRRRIT